MEKKQLIAAKCHVKFGRFRTSVENNISRASETQAKNFVIYFPRQIFGALLHQFQGFALRVTTPACGLILLCSFGPAALKIAQSCYTVTQSC